MVTSFLVRMKKGSRRTSIPNLVILGLPVREIWSRVQICNFYKMADCCRPEVASDIIFGRIKEDIQMNLSANFGNPRSSGSFLRKIDFFKMATATERK